MHSEAINWMKQFQFSVYQENWYYRWNCSRLFWILKNLPNSIILVTLPQNIFTLIVFLAPPWRLQLGLQDRDSFLSVNLLFSIWMVFAYVRWTLWKSFIRKQKPVHMSVGARLDFGARGRSILYPTMYICIVGCVYTFFTHI